jgi:hypothetical protein
MTQFLSSDWFFEIMRDRLLEVYPRTLVDEIIPFSREHIWPFDQMTTITDDELRR